MKHFAYRPEIDGLRAVAVVIVLLFHARLGMSGGYVGVDVFFVISGYLITGLIVKDLDDRTFSFTRFWERRVRRILPASLTMTAAVLVAGRSLLLPDELYETAKSMIAHLCFAANIQFWRGSDNYFAVGADYVPMLHTWSLAIEEQFYLVLPVLLFVLHRRSRRLLLPALSLLAAASLTISIVQTAAAPASAFYLLPARGWELLAGGSAARGRVGLDQVRGPCGRDRSSPQARRLSACRPSAWSRSRRRCFCTTRELRFRESLLYPRASGASPC